MTTKAELIALLRDVPDEAVVMMTRPSHDYWRTTLAVPIQSVEPALIQPSEYHRSEAIVDDDTDSDDTRCVYVLN